MEVRLCSIFAPVVASQRAKCSGESTRRRLVVSSPAPGALRGFTALPLDGIGLHTSLLVCRPPPGRDRTGRPVSKAASATAAAMRVLQRYLRSAFQYVASVTMLPT